MNLDAIWQTHRRFITGVAIGLAGFVAGLILVQATAGKRLDAAENRIRAAENKLRTPSYGESAVNALQRRLAELAAQNQSLAAHSLPPRRPEFRPAPGQSPSQHYIDFTGSRRQELVGLAIRRNVDVDETLGLPPVSPTDPQAIERVLRGFDVVDRVVRLAVEAGAVAIQDAEIQTRSSTRRSKAPSTVLDTTPVTLDVILPEARAHDFTHALVSTNPGLPLVRVELGPADPRKRVRRASLELAVGELPPAPGGEVRP